jgi:hypothetical protein
MIKPDFYVIVVVHVYGGEWLLFHVNQAILWRDFFFAILWREQVNFQWNDDEVRFVLDQHA